MHSFLPENVPDCICLLTAFYRTL